MNASDVQAAMRPVLTRPGTRLSAPCWAVRPRVPVLVKGIALSVESGVIRRPSGQSVQPHLNLLRQRPRRGVSASGGA
jgi:hypothetical protein